MMERSKFVKRLAKRIVTMLVCAGLLMCMAAPAVAATDSRIIDVSTSLVDRFINFFVRIVLLVRGSKAIFSSDAVAEKYLDTLQGNQGDYELTHSFTSLAVVSAVGGMQCVTLTKQGGKSEKVIIYLSGGAFVREPTSEHWELTDEICRRTGAKVIAAVYPKAPTNTCTVTYEALLELYALLLEEHPPESIIIMGDSAGGTIAVSFTQWLKNEGLPQPSQLILFSPMLDLALDNSDIRELMAADPMLGVEGMHLCVSSWLGDIDIDSPLVNPMECDYSALPDITVFCGTKEILVFDMELFYNNACEKSPSSITMYRYDGMYHDFVLYPLAAARDAKDIAIKLING